MPRMPQPVEDDQDSSHTEDIILGVDTHVGVALPLRTRPLTTALALALAGWVLHATYPHTWPELAAVTCGCRILGHSVDLG